MLSQIVLEAGVETFQPRIIELAAISRGGVNWRTLLLAQTQHDLSIIPGQLPGYRTGLFHADHAEAAHKPAWVVQSSLRLSRSNEHLWRCLRFPSDTWLT